MCLSSNIRYGSRLLWYEYDVDEETYCSVPHVTCSTGHGDTRRYFALYGPHKNTSQSKIVCQPFHIVFLSLVILYFIPILKIYCHDSLLTIRICDNDHISSALCVIVPNTIFLLETLQYIHKLFIIFFILGFMP